MNKPLISVVIPAYCASKYLERTLNSVLAQTYKNIEVLIVDDGSTDSTHEVAARIGALDSRIKLFKQENSGVAAARNLAISKAQGYYVAPIDADDIWQPTYLEKLIARFEEADSDVGVVYAWSHHMGEKDDAISGAHAYMIEDNVFATMVCHYFLGNASCTLIRRGCLDEVGFYSTKFREHGATGCEDWDLHLRLAHKYKFKVVPEFLVGYRKVSDGISQNCETMARAHALVLTNVQDSFYIPEPILALSKSSFYIYLASQSAMFRRPAEARKWIVKAAQAELISTILRFDIYPMILKLLVKPHSANCQPESTNCQLTVTATTHCKLLAGTVLHHTLSAMYSFLPYRGTAGSADKNVTISNSEDNDASMSYSVLRK